MPFFDWLRDRTVTTAVNGKSVAPLFWKAGLFAELEGQKQFCLAKVFLWEAIKRKIDNYAMSEQRTWPLRCNI